MVHSTNINRICQREEDLSKLCANQSEVNNNIFRCDSQESSSKNGSRIVKEGDNITLVAQGDHWGQGCSFEIKNTENGVTCCYIDENREDQRKGDGPKLCNETKQPDECRQPGSGRYKVTEILEKTWCKLLLIGSTTADSGFYKIQFLKEPTAEKEVSVTVERIGRSTVATLRRHGLFLLFCWLSSFCFYRLH